MTIQFQNIKMRFIYFLIFAFPFFSFCQENEFKKLLQADSTWTNEFFQFPLSFAPTINYEGYEEAVFPKYWSDSSNVEFWSYAFAWEISRNEIFTEKELEIVLKNYFNGLMNYDSTQCKIFKKDQINNQIAYFGSISTQDAFFSQKSFNLNIRIEQFFNEKSKKMIVLVKLSPQSFEKDIWVKLNELQLIN